MKEVTQWWTEVEGQKHPWLLYGKGPSFERRVEFDCTPFLSIALNHVVERLDHADVVSAIDLEVVRDCGAAIRSKARFLLMPRYPHPHPDLSVQQPERPLESYFDELPLLKELSEAGRLVWYGLATGPKISHTPVIPCGFFSAEVIIKLLGTLGAKTIRTLGIDGGRSYAGAFKTLESKTLLSNGQPSFDIQFDGIHRAVKAHKLHYAPMTTEIPIRIYIGTDETQMIGTKVLQYSIRKHTPVPVAFDDMMHVRAPMPRDKANQPRTGFSFHRFAIPRLAGYQGRAIYLDADMLVFHTIEELWNTPLQGATVLHCASSDASRVKQFSVLLLDCQRLKWELEAIVQGLDNAIYGYDSLMKEICLEPPDQVRDLLSPYWNSLEMYDCGKTRLIHYTDMQTQPWVYRNNRNGAIWVQYLREALTERAILFNEVQSAIQKGFIRPSLRCELSISERVWPKIKNSFGRFLDRRFVPHRRLNERLSG